MVSEELRTIIENISKQGKMSFLEATTEDITVAFEKENGITLPVRYKEWLQLSDGGEFFLPAGIQLYGVAHKPVIDVNNDSRPNEKYIVIGTLASGDPILCEKDGEKISIYNQEADRIEDDEVYEDFIAFLKDLYEKECIILVICSSALYGCKKTIDNMEDMLWNQEHYWKH